MYVDNDCGDSYKWLTTKVWIVSVQKLVCYIAYQEKYESSPEVRGNISTVMFLSNSMQLWAL